MAAHETLFADIDSMEPDRFAAHLADDVSFRFGNADTVHGRDAVRDVWAGFCETVDGVSHEIVEQFASGEAVIAESNVTYTKKDGWQGHRPRGHDLPRSRRSDRRLPRLHRPRAPVRLTQSS